MGTLNVQGFNNPKKRSHILYNIHQQEIHVPFYNKLILRSLLSPNIHVLLYTKHWFTRNYLIVKPKGSLQDFMSLYSVIEIISDSKGRYLFLKCTLYNQLFTLVHIYLPNTGQTSSFLSILTKSEQLASGCIILCGDFNSLFDPLWDSSSGKSRAPFPDLHSIIHRLQIDNWRMRNPTIKDYTYESAEHSSYSLIDSIFAFRHILSRSPTATIGSHIWSDHFPVSTSFHLQILIIGLLSGP